MKKFLLVLTAVFAMSFMANAQIVIVGNGTGTTYQVPFNSLYGYSFTEQVFSNTEIGTGGPIYSISFYLGGSYNDDQVDDIVLYMKHVSRDQFGSTTDYEPVSAADIVYSGQWTIPANILGWVTINLNTPFVYDGTSNLMIAMLETTSGYNTRYFQYTEVASSGISYYSDTYVPDPENLDTYQGTKMLRDYRSNIRLNFSLNTIADVYINGFTEPSWGANPDFDVELPTGAHYSISEVYWCCNHEHMLQTDVFNQEGVPYFMGVYLTPEDGYTFSGNTAAFFNGDCSLNDALWNSIQPDGRLIVMTIDFYLTAPVQATTYGFDDGTLQGWTTIDADGDGFCWVQASVLMAGYNIPSHDGEDCVTSQSYDSDQGALTPDNYLVSPVKAYYTDITFWACAQDPDWAAEHFGVAVSTGSNSNPADFTTVHEWTMTAKRADATQEANVASKGRDMMEGTWYEYSVNFAAYAGQEIWVAIRHFNCTDQFYINVDEVTLYYSGEGVTENNVNLFSMYPNPAKDNVMIESEVNVNRYDIYNITGALVMSNEVNAETFTVNVENLPAGAYIIRLTSDGIIQNRRFIKE